MPNGTASSSAAADLATTAVDDLVLLAEPDLGVVALAPDS
jgi:hypothetical protein